MTEHDRSMIDKVKDALGMGGDDRDRSDADAARDDEVGEIERPVDDASPARDEPVGGIDGATQASGYEGASGGGGASGAMGGAGAAGPVGTAPSGDETTGGTADAGRVRTEYEMGNEFEPDHERRREGGGLLDADEDAMTGRRPEDDETLRPRGTLPAAAPNGPSVQRNTDHERLGWHDGDITRGGNRCGAASRAGRARTSRRSRRLLSGRHAGP